MNTLTKDVKRALRKAKEVAAMREEPVWLHFATTLTFYIDYIPEWWTPKELERRRKAGEILYPDKRIKVKTHRELGLKK